MLTFGKMERSKNDKPKMHTETLVHSFLVFFIFVVSMLLLGCVGNSKLTKNFLAPNLNKQMYIFG